jgi:hypothetical protein
MASRPAPAGTGADDAHIERLITVGARFTDRELRHDV